MLGQSAAGQAGKRQGLPAGVTGLANQRWNHHFKLAHILCDDQASMTFADLNLAEMKALWGRNVSYLGFGRFLSILEWVAFKGHNTVVKIDRFTPTTKVCSGCGRRHNLTLRDCTLHADAV
jgi:putative transposase